MRWDNVSIVSCFNQQYATFSENGILDQITDREEALSSARCSRRTTTPWTPKAGKLRLASLRERKPTLKYPVVHLVARLIRKESVLPCCWRYH